MAIDAGMSPALSLYLISIIKHGIPCSEGTQYADLRASATSIPGRILPPHLGDRIGHFNVLTVSALCTGASILALWLPFSYHPSHAGIIVFASVTGLQVVPMSVCSCHAWPRQAAFRH